MNVEVDITSDLNLEGGVKIETGDNSGSAINADIEIEAQKSQPDVEENMEEPNQGEPTLDAVTVPIIELSPEISPNVEIEPNFGITVSPSVQIEIGGDGKSNQVVPKWYSSGAMCMFIWGLFLLMVGLGMLGYATFLLVVRYDDGHLTFLLGVWVILPTMAAIIGCLLIVGSSRIVKKYTMRVQPPA